MNILITGNTGYIGRHLQYVLEKQGHKTFTINSNLNNLYKPFTADNYLNFVKLDVIYHLAAWTKAGTFPLHHKADLWIKNSLINTHILDYWLRFQKQATFITMGTSCGYSPGIKMTEENYLEGPIDQEMLGYASVKRNLLYGLQCIREQYGLTYRYFIPSTICGPNFELTDTHFNFDFVKKICCDGKQIDQDITLWGSGNQKRELVDIKDVIDIITTCKINNEVINLSPGIEYSLKEYAKMICNIIGYDFNRITWDTSQWEGVQSKNLINTKLTDFEFRKIEDTLYDTIKYYMMKKYGIEI